MLLSEIIRRLDNGYVILSHDGSKKLSRIYKSKKEAVKRLRQIEWWKHHSK